MPRNIYKPESTSPFGLFNIKTGKGFSDDRDSGVLPTDADIPSYKTRKNASVQDWYIEIKVSARGKSAGKSYWMPIKDKSSVSWMDNTVNPINQNQPPKTSIPKPPAKPAIQYIEKRHQRDFSIKKSKTLELLEKQHKVEVPETFEDDEQIIKLIINAKELKPDFLKMEEDSWKLLVRSAVRGKNVMMLGDKGEGKTMAAYALKNALGRPFFHFDFGNTQDAQTALIGKTHLDTKTGTWFNKAEFVKALETENAIILCDEITRMSDDASNILFPVFDENQRHLRLNESEKTEFLPVAKGVCFIATANIGFQYTGTRKLDAAMFDRWVKIEVDHLKKEDRINILNKLFPDLTDYIVETIAEIADKIRESYESNDPKVTSAFSTRMCITLAELIYDGFSFLSAVEKTVYPEYSVDGNEASERTFVKQVVQGLYDLTKAEYPFKSQGIYKVKVVNGKEVDDKTKTTLLDDLNIEQKLNEINGMTNHTENENSAF